MPLLVQHRLLGSDVVEHGSNPATIPVVMTQQRDQHNAWGYAGARAGTVIVEFRGATCYLFQKVLAI